MTPPLRRPLPRRAGTPKQFRMMLIIFTVRHVLGLACFAWLLWQAVRVGGSYWLVMAFVMAVYAGFVIYGALQLRGQYLRSQRGSTATAKGRHL